MRPAAAPLAALAALLALVLLVPAAPAPAVPAAPAGPAGTGLSPAADRWTATAPGGRVGATLERLDDGALRLSVSHDGHTVLRPAPVGITTAHGDFTRGLTLVGTDSRRVAERYDTAVGKRLRHRADAVEHTFRFENAAGGRMALVVRADDDGIAYRYVLPHEGPVTVTAEASAFAPPPDATAWLAPYGVTYAQRPFEAAVADVPDGAYAYPPLFRTAPGTYALVTEADADGRYGGTRLTRRDGAFAVTLPDAGGETAPGPLATPWRVAVVGDLAGVVESDLVQDLAPPSRVADTSWIEPGAAAWSWWSDSASPHSLAAQKQYVDLAVRQGWEYVLVDEGWDAAWVPELVAYARSRGVGVWLWSRWSDLETQEQRDAKLPLWKSWGIRGVKLDFMDSDTQERLAWYDAVLADTARLRLLVNFHGATLPRGIERTWPHVLTVEAVAGAELYKIDPKRIGPDVNATYPFTRNAVGTMDYTPVTFSTADRRTSDAHELALAVVYESGVQHFADSPGSYARHPEAADLLASVPAVWDETRLLDGEPGERAVLARRSGAAWYLGGITAGNRAQTADFRLGMLPPGRHLLEVFRDADPDGGRDGIAVERRTVIRGDRLTVPLAADGGFAARLCPAEPGRTTCGRGPTDARLTADPGGVLAAPGRSVQVTAGFTAPPDAPARNVVVDAVVPDGWRLSAPEGPTRARTLPPGRTLTATWRATPPSDAALRSYEVVTRARYDAVDVPREHARRLLVDPAEVLLPPPGLSHVESDAGHALTLSWIHATATSAYVEWRREGDAEWSRTDADFDGVRHRATVGPFEEGLVDLEYRIVAGDDVSPVRTARLVDPDAVTVVDDGAAGHRENGRWLGSSVTGWDGGRTRYTGTAADTAVWRAELPDGLYEVAAYVPAHENSTAAASYAVGERTTGVDQRSAGGTWAALGRHRPEAGALAVRLTAGPGFTRADAVRFIRVD